MHDNYESSSNESLQNPLSSKNTNLETKLNVKAI